jgi:CheY-like chemotaxis protein
MTALKKILVVDDDPVVGKSFDRVLSGKGYAVITASNGQEALDKLAREDYDAVFTDIKMPGMNGIEVAARVKAARPWLPVVIVTGYGSEANEVSAKEAGVAAFLRKPLSPEMIEQSAQAAVLENRISAAPIAAATEPAVPASAGQRVGTFVKNVGLFFAAPFIGLAYVVALPFVGLGLLARYGYQALKNRGAAR